MKKTTWFTTLVVTTAIYALALYAAATGQIAWLQQNVLANELYYMATQHVYVFEGVAIAAYALMLASIFRLAPQAMRNRCETAGAHLSTLATFSLALAIPALIPVIAGLVRVIA